MRLAVYTDSLEHLPLEEALDVAVEAGVSGVELGAGGQSQGRHLHLPTLLADPAARRTLLRSLSDRSLEVVALNCSAWPLHPLVGAAHERLIADTFRLAEELGVRTVVTMTGCPGDGAGSTSVNWGTYPWPPEYVALRERQWEQAIELWQGLAERAATHGVQRLAFELHPLHLAYNVPTLLRLREALGPIAGANLDPSHLYWQGADPSAAAAALGPAIHHVHLKDARTYANELAVAGVLDERSLADAGARAWTFATVGRGHGELIWRRFLLALRAAGYDGALSIENEDPTQEKSAGVVEASRFIAPILRELEGSGTGERNERRHMAQSAGRARLVEGRGARVRDLDGKDSVDYDLAAGSLLLGHSPEPVLDAVRDQLASAIGVGSAHLLGERLTEAICRVLPGAERAIVGTTGTEAVRLASRLAREATGRSTIVRVSTATDDDPDGSVLCAWNDRDALEAAFAAHEVAAVILEPLADAGCLTPRAGYLERVRELASRCGGVLVFDERSTGFRLALGGAQEGAGVAVAPDLTILGGALGAGFPVSAVCGRRDLFQGIGSGALADVDPFSANPVCAAAAQAAIETLERDPQLYDELARRTARLASILRAASERAGLSLIVSSATGVAHARFERGLEYARFAAALLEHGVHVSPNGFLFLSTAHTDDDLTRTETAAFAAAATM